MFESPGVSKKFIFFRLCFEDSMLFMLTDELQRPTKKPRIRPGEEIDEKSKKVCLLNVLLILVYIAVVRS